MEKIIVQKYGGSSVATFERMDKIAAHIVETAKSKKVVVVVSAMGDETNRLKQLAKEISRGPPPEAELDKLLVTGEEQSAALLTMAINALGQKAVSLTGFQIRLETDETHGKAKVKGIRNIDRINELLDKNIVVVVAGFQGVKEGTDEIVTLGAGGSNLTAIALAGALKTECENYTDVDGVYAIDPRIVPGAKRFANITYPQMLELSVAGAGVLMDRAVMLAQNLGVKIKVLLSPSFGPSTGGTLIYSESTTQDMEGSIRSQPAVAIQKGMSLVKIANIPNRPGIAANIFQVLSSINIIDSVVAQTEEEKTGNVSLLCLTEDLPKVKTALQKIKELKIAGDFEVAGLTLIDFPMKEESGYLYKVCKALAEAGVNIEMLSSAAISILVVVKKENLDKAATALGKEFNLIK